MPRNLSQLLKTANNHGLNQIHTALPGEVLGYDFTQQRAIVQPVVNKKYRDGRSAFQPQVVNVPVVFPRSGGAELHMPVRLGDGCLLIFSERALELYLDKTGLGPVDPGEPRKYDLTDAIAIMGLNPFPAGTLAENNEDVILVYNETKIRLKFNGDVEIVSPTKIFATAPECLVECVTAEVFAEASALVETNEATLICISAQVESIDLVVNTTTARMTAAIVESLVATSASLTCPIVTVTAPTSFSVVSPNIILGVPGDGPYPVCVDDGGCTPSVQVKAFK